MGKLRPFVRKDSYMPNKKWIPFVIGNGYTTTDGASGPAPEYETVTGNPVSFNAITPFPLRKLEVAFSPVQDLHGYDSPWPAGGGKNLLPDISRTYTTYGVTSTFSGNELTVKGTSTGDGGRIGSRSEYFSLKAGTYYYKRFNVNDHSKTRPSVYLQNGASLVSYSGATGEFTLDADSDVMNLGVNVANGEEYDYYVIFAISKENIQSYAPYSNECPISGWDSLNVEQRGVNVWDEEWELGTIDAQGQPQPSTTVIRAVNYMPIVGGTTLYGYIGSDGTISINWYDADKNFISVKSVANATATAPTNAAFFRIRMSSGYGTTYLNNISINYPATDTAYHAYNPSSRSISISLGSTVYSGTVDVVTGQGEVTHVKAVLDGTGTKGALVTSVEQQTTASGTAWLALLNRLLAFSVMPKYGGSSNIDCICNLLKQGSSNTGNMQLGQFNTSGSYFRLALPDQTLDTKAKVNAWLAENPIELCYEIATPIPIQLTPQEVESLEGDNVMWTDAASLEVTYRSN